MRQYTRPPHFGLQLVQMAPAKMLNCTKKHDHIDPIIVSHWLTVHFRIQLKTFIIARLERPGSISQLTSMFAENEMLTISAPVPLTGLKV